MNTSKLASPISTLLSRLWRPILEILSRCAELKVWEKTDRQGNHYWQGYVRSMANISALAAKTKSGCGLSSNTIAKTY